ncbi:MAG: MotA/TolQ/ExbB proton channel family protein [Bdellovibrionales bacterium]|nr:MotA/TolQ/ExbB proton channel family protein [Bdellovibrionales bacterium]
MQFATLIAFIFGAVVFGAAALTSAKNPLIFLNAHAALVVFGGTFAAAAISFSFQRLWTLSKVLVRRLLRGHGAFDAQKMIEEIMWLSEVYRNRPDQLATQLTNIKDPFLKEAMELVTDNYLSHEDLLRIMMTRTASIFQRYNEEALKFKALAKFPPAFGLMGAVMGMIGIMAELGASGANSSVGPSLALALIGTLYGVALANLVILPLAENLHDSAREIRSKNMMITEAVGLMLEKKNPILMAEDLNSFLLAHERLDWRTSKKRARPAA